MNNGQFTRKTGDAYSKCAFPDVSKGHLLVFYLPSEDHSDTLRILHLPIHVFRHPKILGEIKGESTEQVTWPELLKLMAENGCPRWAFKQVSEEHRLRRDEQGNISVQGFGKN